MIGIFIALLVSTVDGDTFKSRVEVWPNIEVVTAVRVMGIDTPEIKGKCVAEKSAALAAKNRLDEILRSGTIQISKINLDKYAGRVDAVVTVNGIDVGMQLIKEGLAKPYSGGARSSWC